MKQFTLFTTLLFSITIIQAQVILNLTNCNDNCIWTINDVGTIHPWNIDNPTPTKQGDTILSPLDGLAIGHVAITPDTSLNTFVACNFSTKDLQFWDGNNWVTFGYTLPDPPTGMGGHKNDFYISTHGGIVHFDGKNAPILISSRSTGFADIAVDELGRAWIFNRPSLSSILDSLIVMDRQGSIVNRFPLSNQINSINGYGSMMKKDTLFLGFGPSSYDFPEQMISVVIDNNIAKIGDRVIDFSSTGLYFLDLAANNPGNLLNPTVNTIDVTDHSISIYPNPANEYLIIEQPTDQPTAFFLYNLQGILLKELTSSSSQTRIPVDGLPAAPYFIIVKQEDRVIKQQKWVKIN